MKINLLLPAIFGLASFTASAVEYETDIFPIFKSKCSKCHMEGSSKGGVALDLDEITKEIGSSKAIVPGDTEKSDLFEKVTLPDDDGDKMPPEGKGRPMSAGEIAKLKEWIESGAQVGDEKPEMTDTGTDEKPEGMAKRPNPIEGSWTNTSGKTIKATLVRVDGDKAILRMNGKDFPYPIENLTADSQKIIQGFAEAWNKASP
ncbi:hypothetical protein N9B73_07090 [Verrucomicrobiales bacterium]|nr:hypothetical protein [Verrucomicrobiales bacterium]